MEGLARIILQLRMLGFFNANRTVDEMGPMIVAKIGSLSGGEPIDPAAAEVIISHAFLGRVAALNRGFAGASETVQ